MLNQAHDDLDSLYRRAEDPGQLLRMRDEELEGTRIRVNMLGSTHQQLEGQMAVLRGSVDNNTANAQRIRQELSGQEERSGGIAAQTEQAKQRVKQIDETVSACREELQRLQMELTAMTANAQGRNKQFLELRGKETSLTADLAGREADIRSLEESLKQTKVRLDELAADLSAGSIRQKDAREELDKCRSALRRANEDVTAAKNTISGYGLRQTARMKRRDEFSEQLREINGKLESVNARVRVFRAMERDFESYQKSV